MKNNILSAGLYRDGLRRIRVPSIIFMTLAVLFHFVTPLLTALAENASRLAAVARGYSYVPEVVGPEIILLPLVMVTYVMAPVLTLVCFYPLNKRGSSDFYHSLPYTRPCMYFSYLAAILTMTVGTIIGGTILGYAVRLVFPHLYAVQLAGLADCLLTFLASNLFAVACTLVAMSITGTFISNVVTTLLIMFLPRMIVSLVRFMIIESISLLHPDHFLNVLSHYYNSFVYGPIWVFRSLFGGANPNFMLENVGPDIFTLMLSLCYIALGALLFTKRKSETAGNSAPNRAVQAAIRIAITLTVSIFGTYSLLEYGIYDDDEVFIAIIIYIVALIAFFAYEIITTHKWKNLVRALPSLIIVAALNVLFALAVIFGKGYVLNQKIPAESIRSVTICDTDIAIWEDDYYSKFGKEITISDEKVNEAVAQALSETQYAAKNDLIGTNQFKVYNHYSVSTMEGARILRLVGINTGTRTIWRQIYFSEEQFAAITNARIEEQYKENYLTLPVPVYNTISISLRCDWTGYYVDSGNAFSAEYDAQKEIFDTLQREIRACGFETWYRALNYKEYEDGGVYFLLSYTMNTAGGGQVIVPVMHDNTPETFELILKMSGTGQRKEQLEEFFEKYHAGNMDFSDYYAEVYTFRKNASGEYEMELNYSGYLEMSSDEEFRSAEDALSSNGDPLDGFILVRYSYYDNNNNYYYEYSVVLPLANGL